MKRILTFANLRLAIEIILIIAALLIVVGRITPTIAAPLPINPAYGEAAPSSLAYGWYTCVTPQHVAVFMNRVHIKCTSTNPDLGALIYFAVPTSPDSAAASRILSLFQSAVLTNQALTLWLDPTDTSGNSWGCNSGDCRRITGAEIWR